ncbi:QcrA and Rieske domain-containing protein [Halorientalis regularis]|uniref:Menaquinol-cytochrome c reductase iron-sulfur subunit n=1 Tax=Halorientalis regularis TaxID=660518 RepID=A0A1G7R5K6_9EURY|nr:Rieske (2Fe-2S) protein [Halorientalis regularis]SDG05250.1 menaquinol-cytochrome c reductase iron-sulfur subunit precursor [Halorientalis regularis]
MDRDTPSPDLSRSYPTPDEDAGDTGNEADCPCSAGGDADSSAEPTLYQDFYGDARAEMERRDYAKALATIGGLTAIGSLTAPLVGLSRVFEREYTGPIYSDGVALVDDAGERIAEDRLGEGEQLTVFPEPRPGLADSPTLLVRFPEDAYGGDTKSAFTVSGYAAYSKVCTHAGCMVADRDGQTLLCPCHSGRFDPLSGAKVVGGPPPRALPQLPITLSSEGYLVATGDFEGPVGTGGE